MFRDKGKDSVGMGYSSRSSCSQMPVPVSARFNASKRRFLQSILYAVLLGGVCVLFSGCNLVAQGLPQGISLTTKLRVRDTAGWWPTKGSAAKEQYAGNAQCAKCHATKVASFENAAMSHAAAPAEDSEISRGHRSLELQVGPYHYEVQSLKGRGILKVSDPKASLAVSFMWA